jgi:hypothetical protein
MLLIMNAIEVLKGNAIYARVMGDHLMDNCQGMPEVDLYIKRLTNEKTLRLQTIVDCVIKFGLPIERRIMSKVYRTVCRSRYPVSKKTLLAFMKKSWSLNRTWSGRTMITQLLELSFKARFPDPPIDGSRSLTPASS